VKSSWTRRWLRSKITEATLGWAKAATAPRKMPKITYETATVGRSAARAFPTRNSSEWTWSTSISDGLRALHADGQLPSDIDPDDLAVTLLATLQGGLLLAQMQPSARPFETAVDTLLAVAFRG
jgi:hypothetical protein